MQNLWENPKSLAIILSKLDQNNLMELSHFIMHNLYYNIFYTKNNDHQLIYIISLLLKDEISKLKDDDSISSFLNETTCGLLLEQFLYTKDVQSFLKVNLSKIIEKIEMENLTSIILNPNIIHKNLEKKKLNLNKSIIDNNNKTNKKIEFLDCNYLATMTDNSLREIIDSIKDKEMKEVYDKNSKDFINSTNSEALIKNILELKNSDQIMYFYIKSIEEIIETINLILDNLLRNVNALPYSIRCICKIILMLIKKRYPDMNKIEQNKYLSKFFFQKLLLCTLKNPSYLLLIDEFLISDKTMDKIREIKSILEQFTLRNLYKNTEYLIPFNYYFIQKLPQLNELYNKICQVELPSFIEKLINDELPEDYKYDYFKENPNEKIFYRNICFNIKDLYILVSNALKCKENITLKENVLTKLESYIKKIENLKENECNSDTIKFYLLTDQIHNTKFDVLLNLERDKKYFSLKELKEISDYAQQIKNVEIKVKNLFYALLYSYPSLSKNNISKENLSNLISLLKELKNNSYINTGEQIIPYKWYIDSLIQYLPILNIELSKNNYEQLLNELELNLTNSLKEYNFEELIEFIEYIKESEREKIYYEKATKIICDIGLNKKIQNYIKKENIPVILSFNEKKLKITKCLKTQKDKNINVCNTIDSFIEQFPDIGRFCKKNKIDIFNFIKYLQIPEKLENYSNIIKEYLKTNKTDINEKELNDISNKIYDYILEKLNIKLFPKDNNSLDSDIYNNCCRNIWIEFTNLQNKKKNYIFDTYLPDAINNFHKMITEKSPRKKFSYMEKIYNCIYSLGMFNGEKIEGAEEEMLLLHYTFIKAKPQKIYSNCKYLQLFLGDKESKLEGNYLTKILSVCEIMAKFSFKNVLNILESDYMYNCDLVQKGILY